MSMQVLCEQYDAVSHIVLRKYLNETLALFYRPFCDLVVADLNLPGGGLQLLDATEAPHPPAKEVLNDRLRILGTSTRYEDEDFEASCRVYYGAHERFGSASYKIVTFRAGMTCPRVVMLLVHRFFASITEAIRGFGEVKVLQTQGFPAFNDIIWSLGLQFASGMPLKDLRGRKGTRAMPLCAFETVEAADSDEISQPCKELLEEEQNERRASKIRKLEGYDQRGSSKKWRPEHLDVEKKMSGSEMQEMQEDNDRRHAEKAR